MSIQGELFAVEEPPAVPGLALVREAVTPAEEAELAARIDAAPLAPFQFGQWEGKRLTVHYGSAYDFSRHKLNDAPPLPDWLVAARDKLAPQVGRDPGAFEAALLIRYDPGAGIGWHRDRPQYGEVLGLSLGAPCVLRLRRRTESGFDRRAVGLPPRSLYLLSGEVRREWEHSIVPQGVTRRSITLRTLR
uniref:alpha-ketoglutarate-dependent dioxygenase AlkB n=1 Tax=Altererythrobacter segetis TaxID=1104773 RepID=UPI00140AD102|nr:alpha-ketoglutarate-dependent dioxygenase AlkB [Altererythrobacter segetis]